MQQFISQKVIKINNGPSPCNCTDGVVCAYCVMANMVLWDRKEHPEEAVKNGVLRAIKKAGPRKAGRLLEADHKAVSRWIRKGNIPPRFMEDALRVFGGGYPTPQMP